MSTRWPTFTYLQSILSKWLSKLISTNVSFKITISKRHVYIDIRLPWIWNQYFYLGIWINDRNKMIVLPSFQAATPLNSQNKNEIEFINDSSTLMFIRKLIFPIGIIEISTPRNWSFWLYFSSLSDYWPPSTINPLVNTSWSEMEGCENRVFQLLKMRKKKISWNIKTKCVTDFLLTVWSSSMKDYTWLYVVST